MNLLYPSQIAVQAFGLDVPDLPVHQGEPSACGFCGKPILPGDRCAPSANSEMFGDTRRLATHSGLCCPECSAVRKKPVLNAASFALLTLDGAYKIAGWAERSWLCLTPPEPPFVVTIATSTMMHMVWKAKVTTDRRAVHIQFGDRQLTARPQQIKQALQICADICARAQEAGQQAIRPVHIDIDLKQPNTGQLNNVGQKFAKPGEKDFLASLTLGDLWALGHMLVTKPAEPTPPAKFNIKKENANEE